LIIAIYNAQAIYEKGNISEATNLLNNIPIGEDSTLAASAVLKYRLLESTLLFENGDFDKSLEVARTHLEQAEELYKVSHPLLVGYYLQISKLFYEKSDFGASKEFLEKLQYELDDKLKNDHPLKANAYFEYSKTLSALEKYQKSSVQIDSAISITTNSLRDNSIFLALAYGQKGNVSYFLNELDSSEYYLKKALAIFNNKLKNKDHIYIAKVLNDLGLLYQKKEDDNQAISYYNKSLSLYKKIFGQVHPHLGQGYNNVAQLYLKNKNYAKALNTFQKAMESNIYDFSNENYLENPSIENVLSNFILLKSLSGKVDAIEQLHKSTNDSSLLYTSLRTYNLITSLIDKLRTGYISTESKHFLSEKTSYLYEKAIWNCIELNKITENTSYLKDAFKFSEKSRTGILLTSIKDAKAKQIAGLPDSLLQKEESLIQQITEIEGELFKELNKGNRSREKIVSQLRDDLFHLKNTYSNHISLLESKYNNYYQLKYDVYTASVSDVQKNLFQKINKKDKKSYQLLEYFIGKNYIFRFQISPDDYNMVIIAKPEGFEGLVKGLRNSIKYNIPNSFTSISNELATILLPGKIEKKTHLTIVPDGILSYLPFESLIQEKNEKKLSKQNFLIKKASVSYSYSATLSVGMAQNRSEIQPDNSFTGFAPVFSNLNTYRVLSSNKESEINFEITNSKQNHETSKSLSTLPYSEIELRDIHNKLKSRKFHSDAYFNAAASKSNLLKEKTLNSRFLHFATHGLLNANNPEYSGIVLTDSSKIDILTIGEIYSLKMRPEIVSLSACETGLGKLLGGEGLVSFSRGFFFSGTKFIMVSLWQVGDLSTSVVMKNFYGRYAKRKKRDIYTSFQKSRIKIIKSKKNNKLTDWFPFILVGMH